MKERYNQGLPPSIYYYCDSQQREVDVIFQTGHELIPIEIKSSQTFNSSFLNGFNTFKKIAEQRCGNGFIIDAGTEEQKVGIVSLLNYRQIGKMFSI